MAQQTSVEWLVEQINGKSINKVIIDIPKEIIEQAKEMHKVEIEQTAIKCHFEGVRQSAKNSKDYIDYGENYYNETFNK
jgi:hypothetical protein